jgi:hypothetical protein
MENKRLFVAVVFAMVLASAGTGLAMSDHWLTGTGDGTNVGCQATLDNMEVPPGATEPRNSIYVYMYGPSGEFLGGLGKGLDGEFLLVGVSHAWVGSGTYHCHAMYHEEYVDEGGWIQTDNDTMDYYFDN